MRTCWFSRTRDIVSIDYDPGASEANQLNRIKLMIAAAKKNAAAVRNSA